MKPDNAKNKQLQWSSSSDHIATVTQTGVVNGVSAGTATITAEAQDGSGITGIIQIIVEEFTEDDIAAERVIGFIDAIGTVTLDSKAAIDEARKAYDALSDAQKDLVTNLQKLTDAESEYNELMHLMNEEAAKAVRDKIAAIGPVTLHSQTVIQDARNAYNLLSSDQKKLVTNIGVLEAAESTYTTLKKQADDQAAAQSVIEEIKKIGNVNINSKAAIEAAEKAYHALSADQKKLVTNYNTLTSARSTYNKIAEDAAKPVVPKKGTKAKVGKYHYKVTKSAAKNGTVTLVKPVNKKSDSVTVPKTAKINGYTFKVTAISAKAFKNSKNLKKVTIGKNVKTIGANAFSGSAKLKNVTIKSAGITKIGKNAFKNIKKNATIKVPSKKKKAYKRLLKNKINKTTRIK